MNAETRLTWRDASGTAYFKPLTPDCGAACSIHRADCQHHRELVTETLAKFEDIQPTPEAMAAELLAHEKRAMELEARVKDLEAALEDRAEQKAIEDAKAAACAFLEYINEGALALSTALKIAWRYEKLDPMAKDYLRELARKAGL